MPSHTAKEREKRRLEAEIKREEEIRKRLEATGKITPQFQPKGLGLSFGEIEKLPKGKGTPIIKGEEPPKPPEQKRFEFQEIDEGDNVVVTTPEGESFFISRRDLETFQKQAQKRGLPAVSGEQAEFERKQAEFLKGRSEKALELFRQFQGQPLPPDVLATLKPHEIDEYQSLTSSLISGGITVAGGAAGALIGGAFTGGIAAVGGAAIGAGAGAFVVSKILGNVQANIKEQVSDYLKASAIPLKTIQTNLQRYITSNNQGGNSIENTQLFYNDLEFLKQEWEILKLDVREYKNYVGEDGHQQLVKYEIFFERTLPRLEQDLQSSIINPNPNKILLSALDLEEQQNL